MATRPHGPSADPGDNAWRVSKTVHAQGCGRWAIGALTRTRLTTGAQQTSPAALPSFRSARASRPTAVPISNHCDLLKEQPRAAGDGKAVGHAPPEHMSLPPSPTPCRHSLMKSGGTPSRGTPEVFMGESSFVMRIDEIFSLSDIRFTRAATRSSSGRLGSQ